MSTTATTMKLNPLSDYVVVEPFEEEKTSTGGIILPDSAQRKSQEGTVVAVGRGKLLKDGTVSPLEVKVGDVVLFDLRMSTEISSAGKDFLVLKSDAIFATVRD